MTGEVVTRIDLEPFPMSAGTESETLALTGRMLLAPHSSTEPPTTMANRLLSFCRSTYLCTAHSWFPRKRIHHWTWYSNDGFTKKAIGHIIILRRWLRCVTKWCGFRDDKKLAYWPATVEYREITGITFKCCLQEKVELSLRESR